VETSTRLFRLAELNALVASGGLLNGSKIILIANDIGTLTTATLLAAITEPTFTGYAPVTAAWGAAFVGVDAAYQITSPSIDWVATATSEDIVYGWAVVNTAVTELYYGKLLDTPVPMQAIGQGLLVQPIIRWAA
jgi:hypothetical protein